MQKSYERTGSIIPFGGDILKPIERGIAAGGLACIQGLDSTEIDDNIIWDVPGTLFPEMPEFPDPSPEPFTE